MLSGQRVCIGPNVEPSECRVQDMGRTALVAIVAALLGVVALAACGNPGQPKPAPVTFKCEIRCSDHEAFGFDGFQHTVTRAGSGVDDQWSPWGSAVDSRPFPFDVDTVNNPVEHEAYEVFTLTGAATLPGAPRPVPARGEIGILRFNPDGSVFGPTSIGLPQGPAPPFPTNGFFRVSATVANSLLRVCGLARGDIWIDTRDRTADHADGTPEDRIFRQQWARPEDSLGDRAFVDVACAGVWNPATASDDLHVFGVSQDGHLLRTVSSSGQLSSWTPWEDVEVSLSRDLGWVRHVDAAGRLSHAQLAVVESTEEGNAWYFENRGSWQHLRNIVLDVNAVTSPINTLISVGEVAVGFCDADVPQTGTEDWQLNILLQDQNNNRLLHTILAGTATSWHLPTGGVISSPSLWKPFTDILAATGRTDPTGMRRLDPPTIGEFPVKT